MIDTARKRLSMLNFGLGPSWDLLVVPDGSLNLADRQTLLDCYSGILFATFIVEAVVFIAELADGRVISAKLADGFAAVAELADGFAAVAELADGFVAVVELADGRVITGVLRG